jgi:hypothetical protein
LNLLDASRDFLAPGGEERFEFLAFACNGVVELLMQSLLCLIEFRTHDILQTVRNLTVQVCFKGTLNGPSVFQIRQPRCMVVMVCRTSHVMRWWWEADLEAVTVTH